MSEVRTALAEEAMAAAERGQNGTMREGQSEAARWRCVAADRGREDGAAAPECERKRTSARMGIGEARGTHRGGWATERRFEEA